MTALLPALPEALIVRRNAHGFSHSFTALQMDKYGRDCAAEEVKVLRGQISVLVDLLRESLSVINTIEGGDSNEIERLADLELKIELAIEGAIL